MKLTNRYNLPKAFERFESKNSYSKGDADISVTTLIDAPQIRYLKDAHDDELEEDISDRLLALLGTAVHLVLKEGAEEPDIAERRLYAEINGVTISGAMDLFELLYTDDDGTNHYRLTDYKTVRGTSIVINPEGQQAWINQLNCYNYLANINGFFVDELEIVAVVRDWNHAAVRRNVNFPKHAVHRVPIVMWPENETKRYIEERVKLHALATPPHCTDEERWVGRKTYAVHEYKKKGGLKDRATRLFNTNFDAESFVLEKNLRAEVIDRKSVPTRCIGNYCQVSQFCEQFKYEQEI